MTLASDLLTKTVTDGQIRYTVSVSIEFSLFDVREGVSFTGGETADHVLTTDPGDVGRVAEDRYTGVSTAPLKAPDRAPRDPEPSYRAPAWVMDRKHQLRGQSLTTLSVSTASTEFPSLNYDAMANYALYWTETARAATWGDPKYGDSAGDNCTNFASQALHAGGWPIRDTTALYQSSLSYWDYDMTGPGRFTYTWSRSDYSYRRLHERAGLATFGNINDGWYADLLYADWDAGGAVYGDGKMDHVMVATKRSATTAYWSQKSGNRRNVPTSQVKSNTAASASHWKWYGQRT